MPESADQQHCPLCDAVMTVKETPTTIVKKCSCGYMVIVDKQ